MAARKRRKEDDPKPGNPLPGEITEFGRRLKAARILREMDQRGLKKAYGDEAERRGRQRGVTVDKIGDWEGRRDDRGEPALTPPQFETLTAVLQVSERWFDPRVSVDELLAATLLELPEADGSPKPATLQHGNAGTQRGRESRQASEGGKR